MNDKIIKKLLEHDEEFKKVHAEIKENHDEVMGILDNVMVIINRLDQERVFTFEIVKRLQKDIERQEKELQKVKKVLKIA